VKPRTGVSKLLLKKLALIVFAFALWLPSANAMEFAVLKDSSGRNVLFMYGGIERDDAEKFQRAASRVENLRGFWLSSGGGLVNVSYQIGRMIRQSRLPVTVPSLARLDAAVNRSGRSSDVTRAHAYVQRFTNAGRPTNICASACGMLLAGGVLRFVDEAGTVGLHSASSLSGPIGDLADNGRIDREEAQRLERHNQNVGIRWSRYMQEMGIPLTYTDVASRVPSTCMFFLGESDLRNLNVVNVQGHKPAGSRRGRCVCGRSEEAGRLVGSGLPNCNLRQLTKSGHVLPLADDTRAGGYPVWRFRSFILLDTRMRGCRRG